jgi:hypothetical protein
MSIKTIRETLEKMKGRTFAYSNKQYLVKDYVINQQKNRISLTTDKRTFEKDLESALEFLSYFREVEEMPEDLAPAIADRLPVTFKSEEITLVDSLTKVLMDNITKVQDDPKYIPQATSINNNVNSIINLTKLKLDVYKQFKTKTA